MKTKKFWILMVIVILGLTNINMIDSVTKGEEKIILLSPEEGEWVGIRPTFKWKDLDGDQSYTIHISKEKELLDNKNFDIIEKNKETDINSVFWDSASWKGDHLDVGLYYWMVSSSDGNTSNIRKINVGHAINITVTDINGVPIESAEVSIKESGGHVPLQKNKKTDKDGKITLFYNGECTISIYKEGYVIVSGESSLLDINVTENQQLIYIITNKGMIEIKVKNENGDPISINPEDISIFAEDETPLPFDSVNLQENSDLEKGCISLNLDEGNYLIRINKDGFEGNSEEKFEIRPNGSRSLIYVLYVIRHEFTLTVTSDETPIPFAEACMDGKSIGLTDENGQISFYSSIGDHNFIVKKEGYTLYQETRNLQENDSIPIDLTPIIDKNINKGLFFIIVLITVIFFILFIILLILIMKQKKINSISLTNAENQIKRNEKEIRTMKEYIAEILRRT